MNLTGQFDTERYLRTLEDLDPLRYEGRVARVVGLTIEAEGLNCELGEVCLIHSPRGEEATRAEVVGFNQNRVVLMPLAEMHGIRAGSRVLSTGRKLEIRVGRALLEI